MQKRTTARGKSAESQRRHATPNGARSGHTLFAEVTPDSGEVTLGGHADRGLTLAAFYDTGVLERLRIEVRARLIMDLTLSLAWLHANPRLMAAHSHLVIAPTTVVIGLDGVARVDVRAAKKRFSDLSGNETEYAAPELSLADAVGDHRADIFSLGMLTWEALAGRRLFEEAAAPSRGAAASPADEWRGDLPATLAGPARLDREPARRKPAAGAPARASHARLRLAPPSLSLPADAEWALPLLEIAMQALNLDVTLRPQDCRSVLACLEQIDSTRLATHQEIAEVVQGISAVATLCVPEPTLPSVDAMCQVLPAPAERAFAAAGCSGEANGCFQPRPPARPQLPVPAFEPPAAPPAGTSATVAEHALQRPAPPRAWFWVGLLWLATMGLLAGYVTAVLAHR